MGQPAAKEQDKVIGVDTHIVMIPTPGGPVPAPLPHPFTGTLDGSLSSTVKIGGKAAATVDSTATNQPSHLPTPPGASFQKTPVDKATVTMGSATVTICGKKAARMGDAAKSCNDPADAPVCTVIAAGTVMIGG